MQCAPQLHEIHSCQCLNSARVVTPSSSPSENTWPESEDLTTLITFSSFCESEHHTQHIFRAWVSLSRKFLYLIIFHVIIFSLSCSSICLGPVNQLNREYVPSPQLDYVFLWTQISLYYSLDSIIHHHTHSVGDIKVQNAPLIGIFTFTLKQLIDPALITEYMY